VYPQRFRLPTLHDVDDRPAIREVSASVHRPVRGLSNDGAGGKRIGVRPGGAQLVWRQPVRTRGRVSSAASLQAAARSLCYAKQVTTEHCGVKDSTDRRGLRTWYGIRLLPVPDRGLLAVALRRQALLAECRAEGARDDLDGPVDASCPLWEEDQPGQPIVPGHGPAPQPAHATTGVRSRGGWRC
jgi:hypothetical protein